VKIGQRTQVKADEIPEGSMKKGGLQQNGCGRFQRGRGGEGARREGEHNGTENAKHKKGGKGKGYTFQKKARKWEYCGR